MSGANQQQNRLLIRDEFSSLLEREWTRPVACQDECPPKTCSCQRNIVHVHALEAWWNKKASETPEYTKLKRFLDEMPVPAHRNLPVQSTRISSRGQSCLRILSLLLKQGRDHLIDRFYLANIYDHYIERSENDRNLREQLAGVVKHEEVENIMDDFHKEKWQYCPLSLTLDMERNLCGTRVIPPFCSKIKLPDKGGTASIYWVAVQKDLITDSFLASALEDSLYMDGTYGECYQMVLKSYCGNKKRDFELEKEAFSGLQSKDEAPILKYLGSYTHDYGEGEEMGKTYNMLLEYGENDLYQAWADETNVPPVQAHEILQSWRSLFKVAGAIRHLHKLEILRGKGEPRRFHGWHADIKPDNILSVRGRLKLADFGFSSFAPVIEGHDGSEPTELIRGYTKTYGAPELSRMQRPDGTMSGVSQSIDAWSFGCVLSVAATWIVLGFQGLRQYERLRQLSPANNKDGLIFDRFHDGTDVLPEIEKWHNYLRGHLRPSDTTTELVLDLIEHKLLRGDPTARCNIEELCEKLEKLSNNAEREIKSLKKHSKDTDPMVMRALKRIEEEALVQRSSEPKTNLLQQPLLQVNPRERASMQISKEELIRQKPLGQTAHRKQILEQKLENFDVMKTDDMPLSSGVHNGDYTHSPTGSMHSEELPYSGRGVKPVNPRIQVPNEVGSSRSHHTPNSPPQHGTSNLPVTPPPSDHHRKTISAATGRYNDSLPAVNSSGSSSDLGSHTNHSSTKRKLQILTTDSPLAKFSTEPAQSNGGLKLPFSYNDDTTFQNINDYPPSLDMVRQSTYPESPPSHTRNQSVFELDVTDRLDHGRMGKASMVSATSPIDSPLEGKRLSEKVAGNSNTLDGVTTSGLTITVSDSEGTQLQQDQPMTPRNDRFLLPLPQTALQLPYDICHKRKMLDERVAKGLFKGIAKLKGTLGAETRTRDASLIDTFSNQRELIFIVDNGWTMSTHWPIVTFVTETLAKNAAGLDKSGFDLKFTIDGHMHDAQGLKGDLGRNKLKKALRAASPEPQANNHATTNMARIFENVFLEWGRAGQPATTLFILTDGVWSNTNPKDLSKTILDIARKDGLHTGKRHFSIQFIRFGDGTPEKNRLQWLDDGLCAGHDLRDIIDHCSWRAKVDKIFKGSIEGLADKQESNEEPIPYDYKKLVDLFDTFNKGEEAMLSPTGTLFRSPSRASHRSSTSLSYSGDWTGRR